MKAIILAAGSDDRLGELTTGKPKSLIDIEGNTLLEIQLNTLHACGIDDVTVVRGYKSELIDIPGLKYYDNLNYETTNVLHSLFCAREEMNEECLILYGDIIFEEQTVRRLIESKSEIVLGVMVNGPGFSEQKPDTNMENLEIVYFDSENRIKKIGKKLTDKFETKGHFNGMVKCSVWGMEILKKNYDRAKASYKEGMFYQSESFIKAWLTDLFCEMAELGVPLYCVINERGWLEINTQKDYERAINDTQFVRNIVKVRTDWDQRAQTYNKIDWVNRDETLEAMIDFAGDISGKKALDVGTGTGKVLMKLKEKHDNAIYYGIDANKEMMNKIDKSYNFNLSVSTMEDLSCFCDNEFEVVTARMVLHHSVNLTKALSEMYRVLKPGGRLIVCEGNPPDRNSVSFYENMFRFKENRHTFLLDDLTNLLLYGNFNRVTSSSILLKGMSLNNWLTNAGVPFRNVDIIRKMHYECDDMVKKAYNMKLTQNDILMDWKFSVVSGTK